MRSFTSTFASTDIPSVSTIPAIPGRVSVAPSAAIMHNTYLLPGAMLFAFLCTLLLLCTL